MTGETKDKNGKNKVTAGGLMIPGGLFLGMGIGWAFGYMVPGLFIGLGAGFLAFGLVMVFKKD